MSDKPEQQAPLQKLRINRKDLLAEGIVRFELVHPDGELLAPFTAGAHITLITPSGVRRQYSLSNDPIERHRYELGIKYEPQGRGGSRSLVDMLKAGDLLDTLPPDNNFELIPAAEYLFIAGGIGITPIMSMLRQLRRENHPDWRVIYCTRNTGLTAFHDELVSDERITIHHDDCDPARIYDLWPLFETPGKAQVYVCGPRVMMDEVRDMTGHWPHGSIHMEDFASDIVPVKADDHAFTVRHADSGETVEIPANASILDTLRKHGHRLPSSCESGTCGTCKTELLEGVADHRDRVLTDDERGKSIMICVSRAKTPELVLRW